MTFTGPPLDDEDLLARLPAKLAGLLRQVNGFIQFHGGLHVRGACREPAWHSLRDAWDGAADSRALLRALARTQQRYRSSCTTPTEGWGAGAAVRQDPSAGTWAESPSLRRLACERVACGRRPAWSPRYICTAEPPVAGAEQL